MRERAALARDESDTAYFFDLMYMGEMTLKFLAVELLASMQDERERHRYALEYRAVRADGIGEWAAILDEALTGPASQHLLSAGRESQAALATGFGPNSSESWQRVSVDLLNRAYRCVDGTVEDLSRTKVSIRHWARQFAALRNRTRGHGSPRATTLAMVCPLLEASIESVVANAPAFRRPWAHLKRGMRGKYRVSGLGGDRGVYEHLAREKDHTLADGVYVFLDQPRRAPLLFTDADLSDFFLPNGNFRGSVFESLSYITDACEPQDGTSWLLPVEAQPPSETTAISELEVVGNCFTNMPPRRPGYISRPTLEEELLQILQDTRHPVVTLQGRGGVGKTSLALEVLHRLAECGDFFAIVWFSARDIDLLPEGPKVVRADVLSTDDVARDFAQLIHSGEVSGGKARTILTGCLSGNSEDGPFVFVFDNFETIREQAQLYSYVNNSVRLPNKVLITTRTRDFKADYPIEVRGMARDEYHALVDEATRRLGIRDIVDSVYEEQLYDESDGHPYITKVLLGEVAHAGRALSLKPVVATREAMLDALFERSFAALSPAASRIFLTLCAWRSLVPRIGLEAVLLRPGNERLDVDAALVELIQTSLVEEVRGPEGQLPFLSVPLAAAVYGKRKLVTSPQKMAIEADLELVRGFGATTTTEIAKGLGPRVARLTRAIALRSKPGTDPAAEYGVIEYIASAYPPAWLSLAQLQEELGNRAEAIHSINRYLESCPEDQSAWRSLIPLYRAESEPLGEMHARLQLAALAKPYYKELSTAASRLNGLLSRREIELDADERRLMVQKLRSLMEARYEEADATDLSRLAWLCMHDHDAVGAEKWVSRGLELDPENAHCLSLRERLPG